MKQKLKSQYIYICTAEMRSHSLRISDGIAVCTVVGRLEGHWLGARHSRAR